MTQMDLPDLLGLLHDEIDGDNLGGNVLTEVERIESFTRLLVDHLLEIGRIDAGEVAFWEGQAGRGLGRVCGYGLSGEEDTLDLFISELSGREAVATLRADDLDRLVGQASRFAELCLRQKSPTPPISTPADAMVAAISGCKGRVRRIRVFVFSDGISAARRLPKREAAGLPVEADIWDLTRITRSMSVEGGAEPIDIDFENSEQGCLQFLRVDSGADEYSTLLLMVPGPVLADLYEEHGSSLLEFNVRSFLSIRSKVNKGMRQTVIDEPSRFIAYNNGIVITAESFYEKFQPGVGKVVSKLINVQIVNGGQTTATIHDAVKRLRADVSGIAVAAKVVIVGSAIRDEMVKKISKYANTQNPMQQADLSANEPFHIAVERLANAIWCPGGHKRWFYERARGQYDVEVSRVARSRRAKFEQERPKENKFSKVDLAKFIQAWDRRPQEVNYGGQKNFIFFMEHLRKRNGLTWEPDSAWYQDIIAIAVIWKRVEKLVRWEGLTAFRANVVAYLVSYLAAISVGRLDLQRIWNSQSISGELEQMLRSWVVPVRDALVNGANSRQKNPTEWFKREDCWKEIEALALPLPTSLPPEYGNAARLSELLPTIDAHPAPSVLDAARRVKTIDAEVWARIAQWGTSTGRLHQRQSGIASTLSGLAAQGWQRDPSGKQIAAAVNILNVVERYDPTVLSSAHSIVVNDLRAESY